MTICLVFVIFTTPLIGLAISFALERSVYWLIAKVKGLEQLTTMDKNIYYDKEVNRCYIVAAMKIKKMESTDKTRDHFWNQATTKTKRLRSRLVKVFDTYYF